MSTLKFADTHNMVAFLSKPTESEGFEQIVDFLNANPIKYALMINPIIYTSCIEQFWATIKVKTFNGEVQLQALVDGKKVIITESTVIRDLHLEDAEGVDCLPNATIFEQLTLMGAKTTAWNEFSSTMASAIICLATNQKFNFSKYIFESMVKNLDSVGKFLMYPRFVQVFLNKHVDGMSNHIGIYVMPSHTKKIFRSMKMVGKGFSGRETPLFPTMMEQAQEEMGEGTSSDSGPRCQETIGDTIAQTRSENVSKHSNNPLLARCNTLQSGEDRLKLKELMEFCTKLQQRVLDLENTKTAQAQEITSLKLRVKKLEKKRGSRTHNLKRLYKVGRSARLVSSDEASLGDQEDASKQERKIDDIDNDAEITLVDETQGKYGDDLMFDTVSTADPVTTAGEVVTTASVEVSTVSPTETTIADELTLAQTLIEIKSEKPKDKVQDKGKGIMVEEPVKIKKKDQISLDEELAFKLQAGEEEERLAREKAQQIKEANIVSQDNVQEMIDADYQMAQQMQAKEQEKLSIKEKSKLFVQLLKVRKKHFVAMRAQEMRNKPPTKAQKRNAMTTYLKNMAGYKQNQLKTKSLMIFRIAEGSSETTTEGYMENYKNVSQDIRDQLNAEAKVVQIILTGIDNDIYSTVNAYLETNLYWEFGKFTSQDGESLESYYSRFYKMMNELFRNQCDVTNHQVNVQFLLQLQPEWQKFVTLVKQSQELKTVSYHKLYDILKQNQNEVNEIRDERLARTANPLTLVAQQQPIYHPQNHPNHYTQNSSTRSQPAATKNRGKAITNSPLPTYDQEPTMVIEDDKLSKEKEIDKIMALISLSFKKIYKPTSNHLGTSSNTGRAHQDNTLRINRGTGYDNQRAVNVAGAKENVGTQVVQKSGIQCYNFKKYRHVSRECQKPKRAKDTDYHKEKMLLYKQEEAGVQLNAEQADWKDDTNDEPDDQELEAQYMYMAQIQEVTPDVADNSGPIFDTELLQKVQNDYDNYNVFANDKEHPEQLESINDTYLEEQGDTNITIDSLDMCNNGETVNQDDDDLAKEHDLLASLIKKLKCEIDDSKNRNKFLESSNKALVDKLKGEIEDFKTKNKSLESSNNHFKEANNELSKTNQLMFKDLKKFQAELDTYHDVNYASKVAINCAISKGDLMSYKMKSEKSFSEYTRK
ncbi:hypothetical protein Tco_0434351, partial [Tanacetum coccineum]